MLVGDVRRFGTSLEDPGRLRHTINPLPRHMTTRPQTAVYGHATSLTLTTPILTAFEGLAITEGYCNVPLHHVTSLHTNARSRAITRYYAPTPGRHVRQPHGARGIRYGACLRHARSIIRNHEAGSHMFPLSSVPFPYAFFPFAWLLILYHMVTSIYM